ncbi:hypothetical protein QAD02_001417 [Eretmocerus hayati]|uniref:Uncharacterized protein n=1 Tax=Eretmocerus hayati TaxID=131215 RepID=A0ACC2NH79_9HYME|nr:hypothetical protein QAD02_001417 [Eretmocerus hayati]
MVLPVACASPTETSIQFDFRSADYGTISRIMNSMDWNSVTECENVDDFVTELNKFLDGVMRDNIPVKCVVYFEFPKWYCQELKDLMSEEKKLHKLWKNTDTD